MVNTVEHDPRGVAEYFIKGDLLRAAERYLADQQEQERMISVAKLDPAFSEESAIADRIFESTFHPSQIHSRKLKRLFWDKIREAREEHRCYRIEHEGQSWDRDAIQEKARDIIDCLYRATACYEADMEDAKIASNAKLQLECIRFLHFKIDEWEATQATSANIDNLIKELETAIPSTLTALEDFSRPFTSGEVDEAWEMINEAKTALLTGVHPLHCVWIDFDGAKRPQTIQFSLYGELVMEDIRYSVKDGTLEEPERRAALEAYTLFLRLDVLIDALTKYLQSMNGTHDLSQIKKDFLEATMDGLKQRRRKNIETMIEVRNTCLKKRPQTGMVLSERVRFFPRLDHGAVTALIKSRSGKFLSAEEKRQLHTIEAIKGQIMDMQHIANVSEEGDEKLLQPVPQVMIANAEGVEEVEALHVFFSGEGLDEIAIVPLFESQATTTPDFINDCLETLWNRLGEEAFNKRIKEIFFAGSDLSKEIGSFSARVHVWQAAMAIRTFNQGYGTNIQIKLGTGEALNRQMGTIDPEGYLDLMRGKIDEESMTFLVDRFGENWGERLKRKPSGFHWLLERYPWVDVFTKQSRAREMQFLTIEPSRLGKLSKSLGTLRRERTATPQAPSQTLVDAAEAEQQFYQMVMGNPASDEEKPNGGFLNLPALIEIFAKISPVLRDRGLARSGSDKGGAGALFRLKESGVEARAIAGTTSASFIFPLALLGHGTMLEKTKQSGGDEALQELIRFLPAKDILREMKCYEVASETVFQLMRDNGFCDTAELLDAEWNRLLRFRPALQEALWQSILPEDMEADSPLRAWQPDSLERQQFVALLVPGTRELLDDCFQSRRSQLFAKNFEVHGSKFLFAGLCYLKNACAYEKLMEEAITAVLASKEVDGDVVAERKAIRREIMQLLDDGTLSASGDVANALENGLKLKLVERTAALRPFKEQIDPTEYSHFLKAMAYGFGRLG